MIRLAAYFVSLLYLSGCVPEERLYGYAVGYGRSYPEPIQVHVPTNAPVITQQFRHEKFLSETSTGAHNAHWGLDIHAPVGTPVIAAAPGVITRSFWEPAYGHQIEVTHPPDLSGVSSSTRYMHLHKRLVSKGELIKRGEQIGELGASGFLTGGFAHLHFEVLFRGARYRVNAADPNLFWVNGLGEVTCFEEKHRSISNQELKLIYPVICQ